MILKNKTITVIGLGRSGFAASQFLHEKGAVVRASDASQKGEVLENAGFLKNLDIQVETGGHTPGIVEDVDLIVTSPGVSKSNVLLELAKKKKIPVISEIELASFYCPGTIIGITGSNGKTTTSHLVHRIMTEAGKHSVLCGNIGFSFLSALPQIKKGTIVVLELSSFQLEDSPKFRPKIAMVLNLSPNHLDRHKTMRQYGLAKQRIFSNQKSSDTVILNHDDALVRRMAKAARSKVIFFSKDEVKKGIFRKGHFVVEKTGGKETTILDITKLALKGDHNLENVMAAAAAARALGVAPAAIEKAVAGFRTLEHRIEPLGEVRGVRFFNDSKSTTVKSTSAAILAMDSPVVLIAGGRDKGVEYAEIEALLKDKVKKVVLYGEAREKIKNAWKNYGQVHETNNFYDAVHLAFESATHGDSLLLSPMCTSFDQFSSFEQRGEAFKKIYERLKTVV